VADTTSRAGPSYATGAILDWVATVHAPHDEGLAHAFTAPERDGLPAIQVAPSEGKLLGLLLRLAKARLVVEVGTLAGYSAIHLARALPPGGHLHSIELDPAHLEAARRSLAAAGVLECVTLHLGAARDVLPRLEALGPFCAVFLDADKAGYAEYGRWAARHLRDGGLLLADNAYLFGRLLADTHEARAMRAFHEEAARAFDSVCIPTPDGLVVGIKR
jgi:caffeoyl-CoA O-methyltransferase